MPKSVMLVTGASFGCGLMTAQLLAQAGHTVYASMRETQGRNAPQRSTLAEWAAEHKVDLRTTRHLRRATVQEAAGLHGTLLAA